VRRAAAAAVSATLSAAVVTIVTDGSGPAPQVVPTQIPSATDSLMPVSVERPTGARAGSARPGSAAPVVERVAEPMRAGAAVPGRPTVSASGAPRPGKAIGRRWPAPDVSGVSPRSAVASTVMPRRDGAPTGAKRRAGAASIGDLHLPRTAPRRARSDHANGGDEAPAGARNRWPEPQIADRTDETPAEPRIGDRNDGRRPEPRTVDRNDQTLAEAMNS
jgi:hypothetical protein